ncbi:uncharacterized protein LOC111380472 [Olea europaea var. sylvestris]|uniref:uncharacterized protein LOC111380472 n=1 Tax=Olea europaea var. sylvestris TaxID=158386 RepID=UPI000C1CDF27|nr:uncharacterized protein LOC111380472 [Olea europaea var. sylvestris]
MPFGPKNVGVTYQRLVNKIFAKLIRKTVEAYVDDMVVKSKQLNSQVSDLEEVFATLRRYNMNLNLAKCAFRVAFGKFLGFMITHRGIETNPDKIQAVISMETPKCKMDIQKLTGRVAALNSKQCLGKGKRKISATCLLVSKVLLDAETRYTLAEQLALTLVIAARKLWPYFQSHPIVVLTNQPLRHILQKPDVSRRLLIWAIELGEFDIEFKPRPAIKAQALADFIAELTSRSSETLAKEIQCALRFELEATDNKAEYEAIVIALELAKNLECERVKVFSDSQLVARAENAKADALSRLVFIGLNRLDRTVHIKIVTEPSIAQKPSVMDIDHEPFWMDPIVDYISNGNIPADPRLARSIRYRAARYCIIKGVLFHRSFTVPYLRYLKPSESLQAMTEVHEGICGNLQGARALVYKLIRYEYYWPSLKKNATDYV